MKTRLIISISLFTAIHGVLAVRANGDWITGVSLIEHLKDPVDLIWSENPLRDALTSFSHAQKVAILLDRRVDPSRKMSLSLKQMTLGESLSAIAATAELGVTLAGPTVYFGPAESAAKLRTLIFLREEEAKKLPTAAAKKFFQTKSLRWENFSQPREIIEQLRRDNQFSLSGSEKIPYDLWAAADLPPMTLAERISLIAVQYDMTFAISANGKQITLVPIPEDIRLVRTYPAGKDKENAVKHFTELAPHAEIEVAGAQIRVKGMLEDHERIKTPPKSAGSDSETHSPSDSDLNSKRFTLTVTEKPIGPLLKTLADKIGLQLQMDEEKIAQAGVSFDQRVSFKVEQATIDELLQAAIKETPLKYRRQGTVLIVEALNK